MMRSLSSAVAGLRTHQTKMDVIGNNIANVNTYGFKTGRATFMDVYYQTINAGRATDGVRGGQNPTQVGYGSQLATIDTIMSNGGGSYTGRPQDIYIDGDGFLTVKDADGAYHYTRLGNLQVIGGKLVDHSGNFVMGIKLNPNDNADGENGYQTGDLVNPSSGAFWDLNTDMEEITLHDAWYVDEIEYEADGVTVHEYKYKQKNIVDCVTSINIGQDGSIWGVLKEDVVYPGAATAPSGTYPPDIQSNKIIYLGQIALATFGNQDGLTQTGMSYYDASASSGDALYTSANINGSGKTVSGQLEMANVELAQQFTDMITTQRGFQANTRIVTVSDEMLQELVNLKR